SFRAKRGISLLGLLRLRLAMTSVLICVFYLCSSVFPASSGGQAGQFLSWGAGARALAMGKAFLAVSDDASATYWNPAGLTQLEQKEFTGLYAKLWYDTAYSFISYAHPTTKLGVFGLSLVSLTSEKFEKVSIERNAAGDVVGFNDDLGDFSDAQTAYIGSFAKDLSKKLAFGASAKYVSHVIDIYKVAFITSDVALMMTDVYPKFKLAIAVQNMLSFKMGDTDDEFPIILKLGAAYKALKNKLVVALDIEKGMRANMNYHLGAEYWAMDYVAARFGFDVGDAGIRETTGGLGGKYKDYSLDLALAFHDLGSSTRVSASWKFGASAKTGRTQEMVKYFKEGMEAYKIGDYRVAMDRLSQAYSIDPSNDDLARAIPRIQIVSTWIEAEKGTTGESEAVRTGIAYYIEGDINSAVMALRHAYSLQPQHEMLRRLLNDVEKEAGQTLTAISGTKMTTAPALNLIEKKQEKAREYFQKKQYDAAINECQEILIIDPKNVLGLKRMGSCYYQMGLKDKAMATWKKVLEIDPTDKDVLDILQMFEGVK
ncbi:MAG: PorV/PorQ family protein, partial [Elusimicrobiota bacterium]|nr:PorV/PorQ family protein [Elusimicrobiota bacterium]